MKKSRRDYMRGVASAFEDLPDGAFFAAMGEQGFDADDLRHLGGKQESGHRCQVCPRRFMTRKALNQHHRDKHPPIQVARPSVGGGHEPHCYLNTHDPDDTNPSCSCRASVGGGDHE